MLLTLSACGGGGGGGDTVTDHGLPEPTLDGTVPTLTSVTIKMSRDKDPKPYGTVKLGQSVRIDIQASEGIMTPLVVIDNVPAEVTGSVLNWSAVREMTDSDEEGEVAFSITFQDISGEKGEVVATTTDESKVFYCKEGCSAGSESLAGDWVLDGDGAASVGPAAESADWWSSTGAAAGPAGRACWFDDIFRFGEDGSFRNIMGDETWIEPWQGADAEGCGAPVTPHDGKTAGTWFYNSVAGALIIDGKGSHIGLPKAVNGAELGAEGGTKEAPNSINYTVVTLDGDHMTLTLETAPGTWWTFRLVRKSALAPSSPVAGKWRLDGDGAASVGPVPESANWWSSTGDADGPAGRACWFDDIYEFGADGSFRNLFQAETWIEPWQGADAEGCGAPVAPHNGATPAVFSYDEEAGTLTLTGTGAFLGLAKVINGEELNAKGSTKEAPASITYRVVTLDGDSMTVALTIAPDAWWTFRLRRISTSPLVGNWKLAGDGAASVGPAAESAEWWSSTGDAAGPAGRPCWFDDIFHFADDGSFRNFMGGETWMETWQGAEAEGCGAPISPHDGADAGTYSYDEEAGTLTITGKGSHLGLAKAVNGAQLGAEGGTTEAAESINYTVVTLDDDTMTVTLETDPGVWWTFRLSRVATDLAGKWQLDGEGAASVGPAAESAEWWSSTDGNGGPADRPCWFDDIHDFQPDGGFMNVLGTETWIEGWQGGADACDAPVAPHDGSAPAAFNHDDAAETLTILGTGAHIALPKAVNGAELKLPSAAPDAITYQLATLDGDNMTVTLETNADAWWTFRLRRISTSPLVGNWKLAGDGAASVGPAAESAEWWSSTGDTAGPAGRPCWFDDIFHFADDGSFRNFMGGETWVEAWQGAEADGCAAPASPHDGADAGTYSYDEEAGTLTITGKGSHLGLAKAVNGAQLGAEGGTTEAPASINYTVVTLDGDNMTVTLETDPGVWWTFRLEKE